MSRVTKWKLEKNKVKVVFRLQFNATHIPQTGWDKLFISFSPADSGKTIAKTTKANVRNGTCNWADPIYETTRLLQDVKNKQFDEKLYKLVVAMGDNTFRVLHGLVSWVRQQLILLIMPKHQSLLLLLCLFKDAMREQYYIEFEQQRELRERGLHSGYENKHDDSVTGKVLFSGENEHDHIDKADAECLRVREKRESEGPPVAMQESLRIVFIKEQYESKFKT